MKFSFTKYTEEWKISDSNKRRNKSNIFAIFDSYLSIKLIYICSFVHEAKV